MCVPIVSKNTYHDTVSHQCYAQYEQGLDSVVWEQVVLARGLATAQDGESLGIIS